MTPQKPSLVCAFGTAWALHFDGSGCSECAAEGERLEAAFAVAVAQGHYDAEGYTPAERRAQRRRVDSRKERA